MWIRVVCSGDLCVRFAFILFYFFFVSPGVNYYERQSQRLEILANPLWLSVSELFLIGT